MEIRKIPIKNLRSDVNAMKDAVDENTVCIVASCPEYAYGIYDPVAEIAEFA